METLVVVLIVASAAVYAAWSLSPSTTRMRSASALLRALERSRLPLPSAIRAWLQRVLTAQLTRSSGCGKCSGSGGSHGRPAGGDGSGRRR
jgi:type II secretory pathway pseudopilin PulG